MGWVPGASYLVLLATLGFFSSDTAHWVMFMIEPFRVALTGPLMRPVTRLHSTSARHRRRFGRQTEYRLCLSGYRRALRLSPPSSRRIPW